jgi:dimethylaniline monooxygenase (N-oxide forming)
MKKRLAIIGAGSSGLICLKHASDHLPDWDLVCLEKSDSIRGCWGNPYAGFVSTSTKYTTQFACYPQYDANVHPDGGTSRSEFFRDGEYGDYLEAFADHFKLRQWIRLRCNVLNLSRDEASSRWTLTWQESSQPNQTAPAPQSVSDHFDAVILATGLASEAKPIHCQIPSLMPREFQTHEQIQTIRNQQIVVFGGGESAVDAARRLANPSLHNEVYLSLRSGIRVSPRYHPIRGVPSDFLRNRLMLSIHRDLRNWIGKRFVAARIRHQVRFEKWFPPTTKSAASEAEHLAAKKRDWAMRLTDEAKDELFDMFHNKSDDFLDDVARDRIKIVGIPTDESFQSYFPFGKSSGDPSSHIPVNPDRIVPAIGFRSVIQPLTEGHIRTEDFYMGCCHISHPDLFLIGFARPIIGNIPSISEMQARYVIGLIANHWERPQDIDRQHQHDQLEMKRRFGCLDLNAMYPVEMFPYCDDLANRMNEYPKLSAVGSLKRWIRMQLTPATTLHYLNDPQSFKNQVDQSPIYLPLALTALLLMLKPIDAFYRLANKWTS